jgi:hypothetical protein
LTRNPGLAYHHLAGSTGDRGTHLTLLQMAANAQAAAGPDEQPELQGKPNADQDQQDGQRVVHHR